MADHSSLDGARMPYTWSDSSFDNVTSGQIRSAQSKRRVRTKQKNQQGTNSKQNKQNVILSLSLREDVKLHETENAWRPGQMQQKNLSDDWTKTDKLYKKIYEVLNKLTRENFNTLVNQVQSLPIDNSDRLEGVVKLVFEKAINEPSHSAMYAQMGKVLATIQVPAEKKKKDDPEQFLNFRKLLVNRCQAEFEKNNEVELNWSAKLKEIEDTTDLKKKKQLQMMFEEDKRKSRMKSMGNIRFIGELFKLGMLTTNIMHCCIRELLLHDTDEVALEGLCVLLRTIGKDLEMKQQDLSVYFQRMKGILIKEEGVSSRIRLMILDLIELRLNKWDPETPGTCRNNTSKLKPQSDDKKVRLGTPGQFSSWVTGASVRKDPKQARDTGGGGDVQDSSADDSKRPPVSLSRQHVRRSLTSALPGTSGSNSPIAPLSEEEITNQTCTLLNKFCNNDDNLKMMVAEIFAQENLCDFVRKSLNSSVEKSSFILQNAGTQMSHWVKSGVIPLSQYLTGLTEYLDSTKNLGRENSKVLHFAAEMLVPMLSSEAIPFCKLPDIAPPSQDGQMICEVLLLLNKAHGPAWIHEKWVAAGLKWSDFLPEDKIDSFIEENKLTFTIDGALPTSSADEINWNSIQETLCQILSPKLKFFRTFDTICDWISANVGSHTKDPKFIRALTTAVCQSSIYADNGLNKLNENHFVQQQKLLIKYIDNQEHLEQQCLYAIQTLMKQMQYPAGLRCQIFVSLWGNSTISSESFIALRYSMTQQNKVVKR